MNHERLDKLTSLLLHNVADLYYRLYLAGKDQEAQDPKSIHDRHMQALHFTKLSLEPYQELMGADWDDFWSGFVRPWEAASETLIETKEQAGLE